MKSNLKKCTHSCDFIKFTLCRGIWQFCASIAESTKKESSKEQKSKALQSKFIPQYNAHSPRDLISRVWTAKTHGSVVSETCPCLMKYEDEVSNCPEECIIIKPCNCKIAAKIFILDCLHLQQVSK